MKTLTIDKKIGGFSAPSKMPWLSYSISARRCKTGGKLRKVKGTICSKCYAFRGNYRWEVVRKAHEKRFWAMSRQNWVSNMVMALRSRLIETPKYQRFFRWFDSGDIQSLKNLQNIVKIAELVPEVQFWLPTQERGIVQEFLRSGEIFPQNLNVRISAPLVGVQVKPIEGTTTSCVNVNSEGVFQCPSSTQNNKCVDCRACWNRDIKTVSYKGH